MRLLEKITVRASPRENDRLRVYNADDTFIASNCWELHANLIDMFLCVERDVDFSKNGNDFIEDMLILDSSGTVSYEITTNKRENKYLIDANTKVNHRKQHNRKTIMQIDTQ